MVFFILIQEKIMQANSGDPDQMPHFVASDLGLPCQCPTKRMICIYGLKMQLFCLSHKSCRNLGSILLK